MALDGRIARTCEVTPIDGASSSMKHQREPIQSACDNYAQGLCVAARWAVQRWRRWGLFVQRAWSSVCTACAA